MMTREEQAEFVTAQGKAWAARFTETSENYFSAMNQRARDMEDARMALSKSYEKPNAGPRHMIAFAHEYRAIKSFHANKVV